LGVRRGAPAITPEGLVGKVVASGKHQALVQTILDPESRVAVLNSRSRVPALARPAGRRQLVLDYVPKGSDYRAGDTVITAGLGGIFPKGLRVGTVVSADDRPGDMFSSLQVDPLADFSRLEWVYIVGIPGSDGPESDEWLDNLGPHEIDIPGETDR
jgi:rod shape-determining protein MreC